MSAVINPCAYPHDEVRRAIEAGILVRPDRCSVCQRIRKTLAHHDDYAKPEDVRWLCYTCHAQWHRENGPGANGHLKKNYPKVPRAPKQPRENRATDRPVGRPKMLDGDSRFAGMTQLRASGMTLEQIGERYGLTRERVRQIIGTIQKPRPLRETALDRSQEIISAWYDDGATRKEIMERFHLTPAQIRVYDFPKRPKPIPHGTVNGYENYKCHCKACREAAAKQHTDYTHRLRAEGKCITCRGPSPDKWHCDRCREIVNAKLRRKRIG